MGEKLIINIEKFVKFHKSRISLLNEFARSKSHGRLIFQISFLGFESLAKIIYPKMKSEERFIEILSVPNIGIEKSKAKEIYKNWRCSLIHEGFIADPWTTLETWEEYDIAFLSYPKDKLRSSVEFPPESIIALYDNLIDYLDEFFKKRSIKKLEFSP